jgi:hypothetical protein
MFIWNVSSSSPTLSAPISRMSPLIQGVDQIGLEAVERLDRQLDRPLSGVCGRVAEACNGSEPLLATRLFVEQLRIANRSIHRSAG